MSLGVFRSLALLLLSRNILRTDSSPWYTYSVVSSSVTLPYLTLNGVSLYGAGLLYATAGFLLGSSTCLGVTLLLVEGCTLSGSSGLVETSFFLMVQLLLSSLQVFLLPSLFFRLFFLYLYVRQRPLFVFSKLNTHCIWHVY